MNNDLQEYYLNVLALEKMRKKELLKTEVEKQYLPAKRRELKFVNTNIKLLYKMILTCTGDQVVFYKHLKKYEANLKKDMENKKKLMENNIVLYEGKTYGV